MPTLWCFQCGASYDADRETCAECGVGLVDHEPLAPEAVGGDDDAQLAYELHAWAFESRRMLDGLLTSAGIPHAWQGASLVVLEADEEAVDDIVDEVERATLPTLDPTAEKVEYDMEGWTDSQQTRLADTLGDAGIPNEFDADGRLLVHAIDEHRVDEVIDQLTTGGFVVDDDEDADLDELGGGEAGPLLSDVFVAADRLRRDPDDLKARTDLIDQRWAPGRFPGPLRLLAARCGATCAIAAPCSSPWWARPPTTTTATTSSPRPPSCATPSTPTSETWRQTRV